MSWPYDYIIIGAGSAGCAIANRLAEDLALRILVIEAGPPDSSFMLRMPAGFASLGEKTPYNWRYETTPQKHCNDRRMYWPRGKTWGGSSSINAMLYVRGHASDYDHWRQLGNEGWSYDDVLPYFKKAEHNERWCNDFHGSGGPLNVAEQVDPNKLNEAFLHAAGQSGYQRVDDFNGANQEGVGYYQVTQKEQQRWSAASAYLRPAVERNRNNVHVISDALVERIILDQTRAMGVRYSQNGRDDVARCSREIILAGGAVNSPQLLMLSGIGPADHLRSVDIEPVIDLPVGQNLQDHLAVLIMFARTEGSEFRDNMRLDKMALNMMRAWMFGTGPATVVPGGLHAFIKTRPELAVPNIEFMFRGAPPAAALWFPGWKKPYADGYGIRPCLLHPDSRGEVLLRSNDPRDKVKIVTNFFSAPNDLPTLREGFKIAREIAAQPPLERFRGAEVSPGPKVKTDAEIDNWIRNVAATANHPASTCVMGTGPHAVVDPQFRVHGVERLRVVDASAMPDLVSAHINACVLMMAEKASDMIRGKPALAAAA